MHSKKQKNSQAHNESQLHSLDTFANSVFILSISLNGRYLYFLNVHLHPKAEILKNSAMLSLSRHHLGEMQLLYFHFLHFYLKMLRNAE